MRFPVSLKVTSNNACNMKENSLETPENVLVLPFSQSWAFILRACNSNLCACVLFSHGSLERDTKTGVSDLKFDFQ